MVLRDITYTKQRPRISWSPVAAVGVVVVLAVVYAVGFTLVGAAL
jgi:hypothetical protein